jgi:hypothetical protein
VEEDAVGCLTEKEVAAYKLDTTVSGCGVSSSQLVYSGRSCNNGLIRWSSMSILNAAGEAKCKQVRAAAGAGRDEAGAACVDAGGLRGARFGRAVPQGLGPGLALWLARSRLACMCLPAA